TKSNALNTLVFNVGTLNPDTTYFIRIGALYNGATTYNLTQPSTSTLTNLLSPSVLGVSSQTATVGWPAFATLSGTNTAQGYRLEAYSDNLYTSFVTSSQTFDVTLSTLTLGSLTPFTTYYLRAGAINWNGVVNYITLGSTRTDAGAAPGAPSFTAVYVSSLTVTYGALGSGQGYELDASTSGTDFFPVQASSITADNGLSTLAFYYGS